MALKISTVFAILLSSVLLTACVTKNVVPDDGLNTEQRQLRLRALDNYKIGGSIGIWTDSENITARLNWQQRADEFDFLLSAPAGLSTLKLSSYRNGAVLKRGSAEALTGPSASDLLQSALGLSVPVPLDQMSLWLRGLPGQSSEADYDEFGRLKSMKYVDALGTEWRAKIVRYQHFSSSNVPGLITATGGPYNVRLVLKNWTLGSDEPLLEPASGTSGSPRRLSIPGQ